MALNKKIRELQEKREKLLLGGGEQAIEKQKAMGKRTARERIMALLDEDSFNEYDLFVEHDARDFDMDKKITSKRWCNYWIRYYLWMLL